LLLLLPDLLQMNLAKAILLLRCRFMHVYMRGMIHSLLLLLRLLYIL